MDGRLDGGIVVNLMRVLGRMFYVCMAVRLDGWMVGWLDG
jgi:hypothetical protein